MIQDQINAEIDATIANVRRHASSEEEMARLYKKCGQTVAGLRNNELVRRRAAFAQARQRSQRTTN